MGVSYSVGRPPMQVAEAPRVDFAAPGIDVGLDRLQAERKRDLGIRNAISMPFYSFAPLLPRRES